MSELNDALEQLENKVNPLVDKVWYDNFNRILSGVHGFYSLNAMCYYISMYESI